MAEDGERVRTDAGSTPPAHKPAVTAPVLDAQPIPMPPMGPATMPGRSAVAMMQGRIEQERHGAMVWRDFNLDVVAMLDARERTDNPAGGLSQPDAAIRDNARAEAAKAGAVFAIATKDLRTLANPSAGGSEFNEIIARRGIWVQTGYQFTTSGSRLLAEERVDDPRLPRGWTYAKNRLTKAGVETELSLEIDPSGRPKAITRDVTTASSVGFDATGANLTVTSGTTTKKSTVQGDRKEEHEQGTTHTVSVLGATPGYTRDEVRDKLTVAPGGDGKKQVTTDSSKVTIDSSGASRGTTKSSQDGDQLTSKTQAVALKRGDGVATVGLSASRKKGTVDEEGTLTKGTTRSVSGGAGLYNDKELGTGLGGDFAADNTYTRKGLDLGMKSGGGGRWFVNVKKIDANPEQVLLITSIVLSGSVGVSVGTAGAMTPGADPSSGALSPGAADAATKDKVGVSVTGGIAASERATFAHKVSIEKAKEYLAIMAQNGEGGSLPEHRMLQAGFRDGWGNVGRAWQSRTPDQVAADAAKLGKDEYQEHSSDRTLSGGIAVKATAGDVELGGSYGRTSKSQVTSRVTGSDEESVDVSMTVNQVDTDSYGANLKLGLAGGSYGRDLGISAGKVYLFHVPSGNKAVIAELLGATTVSDLVRLWNKYPTFMKGRSELAGKTDTEKLGLSVGPVNLKLAGTGTYAEKVDYDESGSRTGATYSGASDTGGSVGVGTVDISATDQRTFTGSVEDKAGANDEARSSGKSERGSTTFSAAKTWQAVKNLQDPLKVVTDGPGSLIKTDKTVDRGLHYGNEDYDWIVWQAHDERAWMAKVSSPARMPDWRAAMFAIQRASRWKVDADGRNGHYEYDAHKVQQALATWNAKADPDRLDATDSLVRGTGGQGGVMAAFPGPLAGFEADFRRYVVQDQIRDSKSLKAADAALTAGPAGGFDPASVAELYGKALTDLQAIQGKLQALHDGLKDQAAQFTTAGMHAEMMGRIVTRLTAVRNEISATQERIAESTIATRASAPLPVKGGKVDPAAAAQRDADLAAATRAAEDDKRTRDAQLGQTEARTNFDQMWRHNADIHRLVEKAHHLYAKSVYNASEANTALSDAKGLLSAWDKLRERNEVLVTRHALGDWLRGPDPAILRARYSTVWDQTHQGY